MATPDWIANAKRKPRSKPQRKPMNFSMPSFLWTTLVLSFGALFVFT